MTAVRKHWRLASAGAPPVVTETFIWPAPALPDNPDATVNLALRFAVTAPGSWTAIDILNPTVAPGIVCVVQGYAAPGVLLSSTAFAAVGGGALQRVLFPVAIPVLPAITYSAQWLTDRYPATGAYPWPAATAHMVTDNPGSAFEYSPLPVYADFSTTTTNFHLSPVVVF